MLKPLRITLLLSLSFIMTSVQTAYAEPQAEDFIKAPTPLDIMQLMSHYLGSDVSPQQLFDLGVKSNVHIPMQHLRVRFTDTRTDKSLTREEIAHILGQSRQQSAHDLISRTFSAFSLANISQEQLIDIFDAAALASMQNPPSYINVEFYDARLGSSNKALGGVSGSLPSKLYAPKAVPQADELPSKEWNSQNVADYFVANEQTFKPKNALDFILPYATVAKDLAELNQVTQQELTLFFEHEGNLDVALYNNQKPYFTQAAVGIEGELRQYIGLLHLKAGTKEKADEMRATYAQLYAQSKQRKAD